MSVTLTIAANTMGEAIHEAQVLSKEHLRAYRPTELDAIIDENAELRIKCDKLNIESEALAARIQELNNTVLFDTVPRETHNDMLQHERDAVATMMAQANLCSMLEYDRVRVCLDSAHAPFEFSAKLMTTFERLPTQVDDLPHYQRDLINTKPQTLGVYGFNHITARHMFITRISYFTLVTVPQCD